MSIGTTTKTLLTACCLTGCSQEVGDGFGDPGEVLGSTSSASTTGPAVSTGGAAADSTGGASSSSSSSDLPGATDGPTLFDLGGMPDVPLGDGCNKVDFLFVIDNSGSMREEQQSLIASFPGFVSAVESTLDSVNSFHVGVIATEGYAGNFAGGPSCEQLSGLITQTTGPDSSNSVCGPYTAGANYMTEDDDLSAAFACAAQIGTGGPSFEQTIPAMLHAAHGTLAGPGLCNEGFIRKDALLVVVLVSDEAPALVPGSPEDWRLSLISAKQGLETNVAVVSIISTQDPPCSAPPGGPHDAFEYQIFTDLFGPNGFVGSSCEADYSPLLLDAVQVVADACEAFTPPG